jgi:thymidine kinase
MSTRCKGNIHLILGPMFCGKTTELIRLKNRAEIAGKKCLVIKYHKDLRYDSQKLSTHDLIKTEAIVSNGNNLRKTIDEIPGLDTYNCIFVDEIQFYEDGDITCDFLANRGFEVVVCGLKGDSKRKPFGCVPYLIPLVETLTHLTAIDAKTGNDASFTARLSSELEQEVIGGADKYIAVDRSHYFEICPTDLNT